MQLATGVTLANASPVLGNAISATLTIDNVGPFFIASTAWTTTVTYGGFSTDPTGPVASTGTSATFYANIPGLYTIQAYTTYTSTNPSAPPPPPTTHTATATVSPPTTATPTGGFGSPIYLGTATTVTSDISSAGGKIGSNVSGWMQEKIPYFIDYDGVSHPFHDDWGPSGPIDTFFLAAGVLQDKVYLGHDWVGGVGVNWADVEDGDTVVEYVQLLRYSWSMLARLPNGDLSAQTFTSELNHLSWKVVKLSNWTWMLERN